MTRLPYKKSCRLVVGLLAFTGLAKTATFAQTNAYWKALDQPFITYESPYRIDLFNPQHGEDGARAWSQTKSVFTYGLGVMAILVALPEEHTGWDTDPEIFDKWWDNVTEGPEWDRNNWMYNYAGHTYFGGVYYQVARKSGYRQWDSFIYSLMMSSLYWEYGIEAFAEVPSIQDLVVTPIMGWIYGEWAYQTEIKIRDQDNELLESKVLGNIALALLDPIDSLGRSLNQMFGERWFNAGYGYITYNAIPAGSEVDHQIYLHWRIPLETGNPPKRKLPAPKPTLKDPIDTGIVGISFGTGHTVLDEKWGVDDGLINKLSMGLYFSPRTSLRLAYAWGELESSITKATLRYENYSLDGQFYLNANRWLRPYLTAGFGEQIWEENENQITFQWNGGLGLHCRLHRKWALQADWVNYYSPSQKTYDQHVGLELIYRFGRGEHYDW